MADEPAVVAGPEHTAVGLELADPGDGWRDRGDMHPQGTSRYRAGIVVRSRFVEDLVTAQAGHGVGQYVNLGAGVDTFAQRYPDLGDHLRVFEIDQPGPQAWKRQRLTELGYGVPGWLRLVPVDFEAAESAGTSWWELLQAAGFDADRPAVVASTGVSMYLTRGANAATLRQLAKLAPGSTLAMTFQPPFDLLDEDERPGRLMVEKGARDSGTPFLSFFAPQEIVAMARDAGFKDARHVSAAMLNARYFAGRPDGLRTSNGEEFLVATT